jgi:hypothetical protein
MAVTLLIHKTENIMAKTLHLVIPGLLGPWLNNQGEFAFSQPAAPALEWLLARAKVHAPTPGPSPQVRGNADEVLFQLFGLPIPDNVDLPVAAVTRLADGGEIGEGGWWLRADPVHLRPDLHGVLLADARVLAIEPTEVEALVAAFNQTFAEDGLCLEAPRPDRWYLRLPADPGLRTHPLAQVIGRNLNASMPYGSAARRWNGLLTEIQMLFHHHPVNRAREERNLPLINSVWFWGGGCCPSGARSPVAGLWARDPLTRGLARLANAAVGPVPEQANDWMDAAAEESDSLVVLETTRYDPADSEPGDWLEHIAALERAWFAPCQRLLRAGKLAALHLHPGNGRNYTVFSAARWRFWQRPRPLSHYLR